MLKSPSDELKKEAALWLDFEEMTGGEFFSYGIGARTYGAIWPDRHPQPEMWQIKKSGQPVSAKLVSAEKGDVEIINRYLFTSLTELRTIWILQADNEVIEQGVIIPDIAPQKTGIVTVPFHKPQIKEGVEYRLLLSFRQKGKTEWADDGFEIAWEEFDIPWYKPVPGTDKQSVKLITVAEENEKLKASFRNLWSLCSHGMVCCRT